MNIFSFTDYREVLRALVKERKPFEPGFGFHRLAEAARIQKPYISKVMKGDADLNADQLFLIARALKLNADEQDFLQLLLDWQRTGLEDRKRELWTRIEKLSDAHRDSAAYISAKVVAPEAAGDESLSGYYLDPLVQIVHVALSVEKYSRQPTLLTHELRISGSHLHAIITTLERMGLIYREGSRLLTREPSLHLSRSSSLYRAWRNQMKLLALQRLNELTEKDAYSFTTVFSASPMTKKQIHEKFLEFLQSCESTVREAKAKCVYAMSFDLFSWTSLKD